MKKVSFIPLFFLLINSAANACPGTLVTGTELKLMGKGFMNKVSEDSIGLACTNEDCSELKFVYFERSEGPTLACFISDTIHAPEAPTERLKQKALEVVIQEFFYNHETEASANKMSGSDGKRGDLWFITFTGGGIVAGLSTASVFLPMIGLSVAGVASLYYLTSSHVLESPVSGKKTKASLNDQKGWNWEADPKRISAPLFKMITDRIVHGQPLDYLGGDNSSRMENVKRSLQFETTIARKKGRLARKGVQFKT